MNNKDNKDGSTLLVVENDNVKETSSSFLSTDNNNKPTTIQLQRKPQWKSLGKVKAFEKSVFPEYDKRIMIKSTST